MNKKAVEIKQESCTALDAMERRTFLMLAGVGMATLGLGMPKSAGAQSPGKPNIILILADDLGYADIGVHGSKDIPTPHIDSLARNGVRFSNAYVSCPVCSPTRAGLMTGRYQQRFGHWFNPGPPREESEQTGLPLDETTMANLLKDAGYATGLVGKWHLGHSPDRHPMKRGFDEFFGFLGGAHDYFKAQDATPNGVLRGTEPVDEKEYLTEAFARESVDFIERHKTEPFFLYLAFNAVHAPMQVPQKYLERFSQITNPKRRIHAAMVSAMDDGIGRVLSTLKDNNILENTLVLFLSDNGGPTEANGSDNTPLSGGKGTVMEGGIRVPLLMQWPAKFPAGKVLDKPVISLDILPTAVSAAGGTIPEGISLDGKDLGPHVLGKEEGEPHAALFWAYRDEQKVIRSGKWKLVVSKESSRLYDLEKDIAEKTDLAAENPEQVERLRKTLDAWASELKPPLWKGRNAGKPKRSASGKKPEKDDE